MHPSNLFSAASPEVKETLLAEFGGDKGEKQVQVHKHEAADKEIGVNAAVVVVLS